MGECYYTCFWSHFFRKINDMTHTYVSTFIALHVKLLQHIYNIIMKKLSKVSYNEKWQITMKSDMEFMHSNKVWIFMDTPKRITPIGCKWTFKRNIGVYDNVETYNVRMVAKGDDEDEERGAD